MVSYSVRMATSCGTHEHSSSPLDQMARDRYRARCDTDASHYGATLPGDTPDYRSPDLSDNAALACNLIPCPPWAGASALSQRPNEGPDEHHLRNYT
jgi:hypothetical protein